MMGKVAVLKKMSQKFIKSCLFEKNVAKMFGMSFYLVNKSKRNERDHIEK